MAKGLTETDIEAVKRHLAMLRQNALVPTKYHVLRQMCEGVQAVPTAMNMDVAQATYFRGMRLALAHTERRYEGVGIEDEGLVDRLLRAKNDPPKPLATNVGAAARALIRDRKDPIEERRQERTPPVRAPSPGSPQTARSQRRTSSRAAQRPAWCPAQSRAAGRATYQRGCTRTELADVGYLGAHLEHDPFDAASDRKITTRRERELEHNDEH